MDKKWVETLSGCDLFEGISPDALELMLGCMNPKVARFAKNETIAAAGEKFSGIGIVMQGEAAVTKENADGDRIILTILGPGGIFGEMAAFARLAVWPATVIAQGLCSVAFLSPDKIVGNCERQCTGHRKLILNMLRLISDKAILLNRKVEYLSIKSMRGRICRFLIEQRKKSGKDIFMLPLSRNELADFLNVSRPSLSREMGRMRDEGMIDFHRSSVKIKDIEALKSASH